MSTIIRFFIGLAAVIYIVCRVTNKSLKELDETITLWSNYNRTYFNIRKNPRAANALWNHPGMKFMRRGWRIVAIIIFIIYLYGVNS